VSVLADDWGIRRGSLKAGPRRGHAVWAELTCSRSAARY
jgi:hypothetical protein